MHTMSSTTHPRILAKIYPRTHTHTHTRTYTYTHTRTHIHIHIFGKTNIFLLLLQINFKKEYKIKTNID